MKQLPRIEQLENRQLMSVSLSAAHAPIIYPIGMLIPGSDIIAPAEAVFAPASLTGDTAYGNVSPLPPAKTTLNNSTPPSIQPPTTSGQLDASSNQSTPTGPTTSTPPTNTNTSSSNTSATSTTTTNATGSTSTTSTTTNTTGSTSTNSTTGTSSTSSDSATGTTTSSTTSSSTSDGTSPTTTESNGGTTSTTGDADNTNSGTSSTPPETTSSTTTTTTTTTSDPSTPSDTGDNTTTPTSDSADNTSTGTSSTTSDTATGTTTTTSATTGDSSTSNNTNPDTTPPPSSSGTSSTTSSSTDNTTITTTTPSNTTDNATTSSTTNQSAASSPLSIGFDSSGLSSITYNGVKLFDGKANPGDRYSVASYTVINSDGTQTQMWGGNPLGTTWDANTLTFTTTYSWGTIACQYTTASDRLTMKFTVVNTSNQNIAGVNIYPVALRFPIQPAELQYDELGLASQGPPVVSADFGSGMVAVVGEDVSRDEYVVLTSSGTLTATANRYVVRIGSTPGLQPTSWPIFDRPIAPGGTDSYTASLRFAPSQTPRSTVASDIYAQYAAKTPLQLNWTDRRPIAELMVASDAHTSATNPNGWTVGSNIDVTTPAGLAAFKTALLAYADQSIAIMKDMNAQGMITWDIEGEQYDNADYIGDPRLATTLAPEMAYQNAINAYFKKFTDAGFRVGVTIRADKVVMNNGVPTQVAVPDSDLAQLLIDKINYAKNNWGATLFYLDSTDSFTPETVLAQVMAAVPGVLLIPENKNVGDYSVAAPYNTPRHGVWNTPADVKATYGGAFSIINAVDAGTPSAAAQTALNAAVQEGDVLIFQGWWNNPINAVVKAAYKASTASTSTTVSAATFSTTSIVSPDSLDSTVSDWLKSAA